MAASGVGQFSVNVKSNLKDFYGDLVKSKRTMDDLTQRKHQLQIDSAQLDKLRDKSQRIAAEMKELRQQKTEIKLGMKNVENADAELKKLDQRIASLSRQKLEVDADIQPIRTANVELHKVDQEIDRINGQKVEIDFSKLGDGLDGLSSKVMTLVQTIGGISLGGLTAAAALLKESVDAASDFEQASGGVNKLFGEDVGSAMLGKAKEAYKTAGLSANEYLEQATSYSASLITALEKGQTITIDSSEQKAALEKRKQEIEDLLKENSYATTEINLNAEPKYEYSVDKKGKVKKKKVEDTEKKNELKEYKQSRLDLQKQKDEIDKQIANLPDKTTQQVGGMSREDAQKKAAEYVDKILVDTSDNVNTFGTDIGLIQNAYNGIAKNNYTMIDNFKLGFNATQEGAIELVNTYGKLDHQISDISEVTFPIMVDAIHNAQEMMSVSGTTAKEAATTYEGSLKMLKGAWENFLTTGDTEGLEFSIPIYVDNLDKKLKELTPKIIEGIKKLVKELPPKLKPVIEDIRKLLTESIDSIFGEGTVQNFVDGMEPFTDIIQKIFKKLSKSTNGEKPDLSWVGSVIPNLLKLAIGLKTASLLLKGAALAKIIGFKLPSFKGLSSLGKSAKELKTVGIEDLKSLGLKLLAVGGIIANIYFAAKALQEVQKVGDLGDLQPKLFAIAEAIAGMGVLVAAIGFLADKKPDMVIAGLATIAGISANIFLAAKALQEVDKIGDFGDLQLKFLAIAEAISGMGILAAAVGALVSTGVGAVVLGAGLLAIVGIAGTLYLAGKAVATISDLELNEEKVKKNIDVIKKTLEKMTELSGEQDIFENIKSFVNSFLDSGIAGNIASIGKKLVGIQELEFNNKALQGNIGIIKGFIDKLDEFSFEENPFQALGEWFASFIDNGIVGNIINIGENLTELQELAIDGEKVATNVRAIQETMSSIAGLYESFDGEEQEDGKKKKGSKSFLEKGADFFGNLLGATPLGQAAGLAGDAIDVGKGMAKTAKTWTESSALDNIIRIGEGIRKIQNLGLDEKKASNQVGIIKRMLSMLFDVATEENVKNLNGMSEALDRIVENLTEKFPPEFENLGQLLANKLNKKFKDKLNLQKIISDKLTNISTFGAISVGTKIADTIANQISQNLNIGNAIKKAIEAALSAKYSTTVHVDVVAVEKKKESAKSKVTKASGGLISVKTDQAILQDSPEKPLLNNGEYVIPKKIVDALGVPFLEKLRHGQISRTFAGLAQSVSHTTSNVVTNVYHNNNAKEWNIYTTNGESAKLQANRRFRLA